MKAGNFKKENFPRILSIGVAVPENSYTQKEIYDMCGYKNKRIESLFLNSGISKRHMFFTREDNIPNESPDELIKRYKRGAVQLGRKAITRCLAKRGIKAEEIDLIITSSCTGYLCPGLSSIMVKELKLKKDIQRTDIQGMGCCGAMPSLQRAYDHVRAYPQHKVLVLCVEICSAAYFIDRTMETIIGNAICGDGAVAILVGNDSTCAGPEIVDFQSTVDSEYLESVGFHSENGKLRIVLGKEIQDIAGPSVKRTVAELLKRNRIKRREIKHWIIHPGGRNVIENIRKELGLEEKEIRYSKSVLKNYGNMSSPTVIFVLDEIIREENPKQGNFGVMIALGPGLAAETALVRW